MDCALLYNDQFTDKLEWIEESRKMKLQDPKEIEVFGIDGRMSQLGYYGLDQLRQGFTDDSTLVQVQKRLSQMVIVEWYEITGSLHPANHVMDKVRVI